MCLGVPGRIVSVIDEQGLRMGIVDFGGVSRKACLAYVPEADVDDYVVIHAGFAISKVDPEEAIRTLELVEDLEAQLGSEDDS